MFTIKVIGQVSIKKETPTFGAGALYENKPIAKYVRCGLIKLGAQPRTSSSNFGNLKGTYIFTCI